MNRGLPRTKIVATVGPATQSEAALERLLAAGVSVFRLNFSHGTQDGHALVARRIRAVAARLGVAAAILGDLQGPKIRTGPLSAPILHLAAGAAFTITTRDVPGDGACVGTTFPDLPQVVAAGQRLLLDDGRLALRVESVTVTDVVCTVAAGGELREHVGINLPDIRTAIPPVTEKDLRDLDLCVDLGLDYVALSFVQQADDVRAARARLRERKSRIPIIAKIERAAAMAHLDSIVRAFDGVMVARGDLAVETSPADVPVFQKRIIRAANAVGKPVITATQMLESMTHSPQPTRAEASDVANAVWDGTDAVMLSGETAVGDYPAETVAMMASILHRAEEHPPEGITHVAGSPARAVVQGACELAGRVHASALLVLTRSGRTAEAAACERSRLPVLAVTDSPAVAQRLALHWGVQPTVMPFAGHTDAMLASAQAHLKAAGVLAPGDTIVVTGSAPVASRGRTNFIKVERVG